MATYSKVTPAVTGWRPSGQIASLSALVPVRFASDLEFPFTTDLDDIATFLRHRGRQVVFSTYQSSAQIAESQTRSRVPGFDLVIAGEAHRCAGKVSAGYGTVLDDAAIRAKKGLFMTATPRTYMPGSRRRPTIETV